MVIQRHSHTHTHRCVLVLHVAAMRLALARDCLCDGSGELVYVMVAGDTHLVVQKESCSMKYGVFACERLGMCVFKC